MEFENYKIDQRWVFCVVFSWILSRKAINVFFSSNSKILLQKSSKLQDFGGQYIILTKFLQGLQRNSQDFKIPSQEKFFPGMSNHKSVT